jgi:hypothetical protein
VRSVRQDEARARQALNQHDPCPADENGYGNELFYVEDATLVAVQVRSARDFPPGAAERLSQGCIPRARIRYDVSSDGRRILMTETLQEANQSIRVVQNWQEELKRSVPTK